MKERELILKNISKKFNGMEVLKDIDAIIFPHKITAFIGPNGAGKTTLFNIITGELKPDTGQILLDGTNLTKYSPSKIAKVGIGRLFQDVRIFENLNVIDNVSVSLIAKEEDLSILNLLKNLKRLDRIMFDYRERAKEYLDFVGLDEDYYKLASELSFGQQKLLSFARLMAADFDILLLDEPTAGISHAMVEKIVDLLKRLVKEKGKTIAIIEHNMKVIANLADWVYFMDEGEVEFTGKTEHILGHSEVREIYMGI